MQPQSPNPSHAQAHPPAGSSAGPKDDVIYEGLAKHSAALGGYAKWSLVTIAGSTAAVLLSKIDFFATMPLWVLSIVGLPGMLLVFLRQMTTRYKVSLRRVETERGILSKQVDSLELWRVLDVRYSRTFFDRITGNGRVLLVGTDKTDPELLLYGLPEHRRLFEQLREAVQAARQTSRPMELVGQDGHIEQMGGAWGGQ